MTFEEWYSDFLHYEGEPTKDIAKEAWDAAYNFYACKLRPMVPEGYVLVPVEPTEAIFKAGVDAHDECGDTDCHCSITDMYKAMIQAVQEEE